MHYVGCDVGCGVAVLVVRPQWFGVEAAYGGGGGLHGFVVDAQGLADACVAVVGEVVEVVFHYGCGHVVRCLHAFQLQQQAFLQAAGAYPCGVEALYDAQHLLDLLLRGVDALAESQVVGHQRQVAAQVAGVVQRAHQLGGYLLLTLCQRTQGKLLHKPLRGRQAVAHHKLAAYLVGVALLVFAVVVVVILVLVAVPVRPVVGRRQRHLVLHLGLKQGVLLQLLLDGLFQLRDGQLQQPHQLYLLRR